LLLSTLSFAALGDYRYALLVCLLCVVTAVAFVDRGRPQLGLLLGLFLLGWPRWPMVLELGWTDGVVAASLAFTIWTAVRRPRWLPIALGCLFAAKQYTVIVVPLTILLLPRPFQWRAWLALVVKSAALAAAITLPFVFWNVEAAWRSMVQFHLASPFRPDSLAVLPWLARTWHVTPSASAGLLAYALAAAVALWRAPRSAAGFACALSVAYLCFFAFNKQAFVNYYAFVAAALVLAAAAPAQTPTVDLSRASGAPAA
jgi:hypothetical protein